MKAEALLFMMLTILVVWGGLASATSALVIRSRRERKEAREEAVREIMEDSCG